jgi:hypothetical protein
MRRISVAALAVLTVFGFGIQAALAKTNPKPVTLTAAQVTPALLALTDMPSGWAAYPNSGTVPPASATGGICNGPNALARSAAVGGGGIASTAFFKDVNVGPAISESVYGYPSVKAAKDYIVATEAAVAACSAGWDVANDNQPGGTVHWTISALSFDKLGDQVSARRDVGTNMYQGAAGSTGTVDEVDTRIGNNIIHVTRTATAADQAELLRYTQKSVAKFGVALQAAKQSATTSTAKNSRKS